MKKGKGLGEIVKNYNKHEEDREKRLSEKGYTKRDKKGHKVQLVHEMLLGMVHIGIVYILIMMGLRYGGIGEWNSYVLGVLIQIMVYGLGDIIKRIIIGGKTKDELEDILMVGGNKDKSNIYLSLDVFLGLYGLALFLYSSYILFISSESTEWYIKTIVVYYIFGNAIKYIRDKIAINSYNYK